MTTSHDDVEAILSDLAGRLERVDPSLRRAALPDRRLVEAHLTDLALSYHAVYEDGELGPIRDGAPDGGSDIRLVGTSADLRALASGDLRFRSAYVTGRIKVEAPLLDMLRFASVVPVR